MSDTSVPSRLRGRPPSTDPKRWQPVFLDVLAQTRCAKTAARQAGIGLENTYYYRRTDPVFAAAWKACVVCLWEKPFLDTLASGIGVEDAIVRLGLSRKVVYARRQSRTRFRAAWDAIVTPIREVQRQQRQVERDRCPVPRRRFSEHDVPMFCDDDIPVARRTFDTFEDALYAAFCEGRLEQHDVDALLAQRREEALSVVDATEYTQRRIARRGRQ